MADLDLQPLNSSQPSGAPGAVSAPGVPSSQAPLDLQPLQAVDQSKANDFGAQMSKGLYQHLPFGKRLVKTGDALMGTHAAEDIEATPDPEGLGGTAGRMVGDALGFTPVVAGATLAAPEAALAAGSLGIAGQVGQEKLNAGGSGPDALKDAAVAGSTNFVGGKALEGLETTLAPLFRGTQGHGDVYRNLLNPGKGTVTDVEIKSGRDINDAFQKMADERLPIKSVIQNNRDTVDTTEARAQLKGKISSLDDSLTNYLKNSDATFDLDSLQDQVVNKLRPVFKNDKDYESAVEDVQSEFDAAKRQRIGVDEKGQPLNDPVDAATLNDIKKGMWQKGYNLLAPTAQKTARIIGGTLKTAIEDAHPDDTFIKDTNAESGILQTADGILQKAHGKVVNGGALGNYLRGGVGAVVGEQIGALLGHPVIGTGAGGFVGEQANRLLNNPELVTSALSKIRDIHEFGGSVKDAAQGLVDRFGPGLKGAVKSAPDASITPEVMGGQALPYQPKIGINRALPGPRQAGQSSGPIVTPEAQPGQVAAQPKLLPKPSTVYGEGFTMNTYKPQPIQLNPEDRKDMEDLLDWTASQYKGERYSYIDNEGQRQFGGTPSGHMPSVQDVGPKNAMQMISKALLNKPMTPMQTLKVNKMLDDFKTNVKPKMQASTPGEGNEGEVEGNTSEPQKPPLGPDLGGNKGSVDIGGKNSDPFYSQAAKTIDQKMPNIATPEQIRGILSPANGVKPDELKWMGLDDYLAGKIKVSKSDLQNFMKENQVQVKEVEKSDSPSKKEAYDAYNNYVKDMTSKYDPENKGFGINDLIEMGKLSSNEKLKLANLSDDIRFDRESKTKFSQHTLPGGKNYREMLLTLPPSKPEISFDEWNKNRTSWGKPFGSMQEYLEKAPGVDKFKSPHFDEPNILAHIRMNDRIDTDGKKVLHIEEVQSDWHQKGKKQGYQEKYPVGVREDENVWVITRADGKFGDVGKNQAKTAEEAQKYADNHPEIYKYNSTKTGVPDAPFKKTWHELAMKRMLRYAAENGYDRLSWTTGAQQAERYDLSKQVDKVRATKRADGTYNIAVNKKGESSLTPIKQVATEKEIPELVGKDLAQKIISQEVGPVKTYEGGDLKVGGEGMKGFYDNILPNFMDKYAKKWGGKVGETTIPSRSQGKNIPDGAGGIVRVSDVPNNVKVHSIDITPAMKKSVMTDGQPLFSWSPVTATAGLGGVAALALGAKNAKAQEPQNRLLLPAAQYTKQEEGFRPSIYTDPSKGNKAIGYGFNVDDPGVKKLLPKEVLNGQRELSTKESDRIFAGMFNKAKNNAIQYVGNRAWNALNIKQQKALTDMSYNMGIDRLNGFKKMKIAIQSGKYDKAADEVVDSDYGRELPGRAHRNAQLIKG